MSTPALLLSTTRRLFLAYVLLLPLRRLYVLPGLGSRLQLTELIFLALGPLLLFALPRTRTVYELRPALAGMVLYLGALSWAAFTGATDIRGWVELAGRYYLLLLLVAGVGMLANWRGGPEKLLTAWRRGVWLLALSGYIGVFLARVGIVTPLVEVYEHYPYFGTVFRVRGVAGGATAFVVLCMPAVVQEWVRYLRGSIRLPWLAIALLPLLLLTFSKELLLLGVAMLVATPAIRSRYWLVRTGVVVAALCYWSVTHYLLQPATATSLATEEYSAGRTVWRGTNWQLVETSYLSLKRAALVVVAEHPVVGVGPDGFPKQLPSLKARGLYPAHLPDYIPHSTWFGTLAEAGLLGFVGLLGLCYGLGRSRRTVDRANIATGRKLGIGSLYTSFGHRQPEHGSTTPSLFLDTGCAATRTGGGYTPD